MLSAFDNDKAGRALDAKLTGFLPAAKRHAPPSQVERSEVPCKDWLDVLTARKSRGPVGVEPPAMPEAGRAVGEAGPVSGLDTALEGVESDDQDFRL